MRDGDLIRGRVHDCEWDAIDAERQRVNELKNGIFITTIFWCGVGLGYLLGRLLP